MAPKKSPTTRPYVVLRTDSNGEAFSLVATFEAPTPERAREMARDFDNEIEATGIGYVAVAETTFKIVGYRPTVEWTETEIALPPRDVVQARPVDSNGNPPLKGQTDLTEAVEEHAPEPEPQEKPAPTAGLQGGEAEPADGSWPGEREPSDEEKARWDANLAEAQQASPSFDPPAL